MTDPVKKPQTWAEWFEEFKKRHLPALPSPTTPTVPPPSHFETEREPGEDDDS